MPGAVGRNDKGGQFRELFWGDEKHILNTVILSTFKW
jgi:hypothetical protein